MSFAADPQPPTKPATIAMDPKICKRMKAVPRLISLHSEGFVNGAENCNFNCSAGAGKSNDVICVQQIGLGRS